MNTPTTHNGVPDNRYRKAANTRTWADQFPYVNGGLFSGTTDVPRFSKIARSCLLHVGGLNWTQINPDIFGSMIQAVAEDEERGALGMHYTSLANILKVLNPLFIDDLRAKLEEAGDNPRMLLDLRKRMEKIRVFDPACASRPSPCRPSSRLLCSRLSSVGDGRYRARTSLSPPSGSNAASC